MTNPIGDGAAALLYETNHDAEHNRDMAARCRPPMSPEVTP